MRTTILASILALVMTTLAGAQTIQQRTVWDVLKDPDNITFLTFVGANVADAKTDWKFTGPLTHKEYTITPAQRLGVVLGGSAVALYIREQFPDKPRLKRAITVGMGIATAYFAGRALANTYAHGVTVQRVPAPGPAAAFAIQVRR